MNFIWDGKEADRERFRSLIMPYTRHHLYLAEFWSTNKNPKAKPRRKAEVEPPSQLVAEFSKFLKTLEESSDIVQVEKTKEKK